MKNIFAFILFLVFTLRALAFEVTIGETCPVTTNINKTYQAQENRMSKLLLTPPELKAPEEIKIFPITTNFSLGIIQSIQKSIPEIPYPLAIVGTDNFSKRWLQRNKNRLQEINAIVLVIQAEDFSSYKQLVTQMPELTVAFYGDDAELARFGVTHYPALLHANGIEQ